MGAGVAGEFPIANWETGEAFNVINQNISLSGNVFEANAGQQLFKDGYLGGNDWTAFVTTFKSDGNIWWNASEAQSYTVPTPALGTAIDWAHWQSITGQDQHSTFSPPPADPATVCIAVAEAADYWLVSDNGALTVDGSGKAVFNLSTIALGSMTGAVTLAVDGG